MSSPWARSPRLPWSWGSRSEKASDSLFPRPQDLVGDVLLEISARRGRAILMVLAVACSIGALVSAVGISTTAARQIGGDIAASTIDLVDVAAVPLDQEQSTEGEGPGEGEQSADGRAESGTARVFPADAESRADRLTGVEGAGLRLDDQSVEVRRAAQGDVAPWEGGVVGIGTGYLAAVEGATHFGRHESLRGTERVAILGAGAAEAFGIPITVNPTGYVLTVDGQSFPVVDFVRDSGRADLDDEVLVPFEVAARLQGGDSGAHLIVRTAPGAGSPVSRVLATAIRPDAPQRLRVSGVVSVEQLRMGVDTQLGRLAAGIGAFLLVLTCLLITNSMIVSVVSRTGEIGLRRALGASRAGVAAVFWGEGAIVGAVGGLTGSALAMVVVVAVSLANRWSVSVSPWLLVAGPLLGLAVGMAASAYPAVRAARISPALAVRSD